MSVFSWSSDLGCDLPSVPHGPHSSAATFSIYVLDVLALVHCWLGFTLTWNRRAGAGVGAILPRWAAVRLETCTLAKPFPWRMGLCYGEGSDHISHEVFSAPTPKVLGPSSDLHCEDLVWFLEEKLTNMLVTP